MFDGVDVPEAARVLIAARALIEKGWCRGESAVGTDGFPRHHRAPDAVKWCAIGATARAAYGDGTNYRRAINILKASVGDSVPYWNDRARDVSEVLAGFDKAIAAAMVPA